MPLAEFGELSASEKQLVQALEADVAAIIAPHPDLRQFCTETTCVRYLRARSWNLTKACKMLRATLEWRLEYQPHLIRWEQVAHESITGKNFLTDIEDRCGRPLQLMRPRCENTKEVSSQIRYLVYVLERASEAADKAGRDMKLTWLIDFEGYTLKNAPAVKTSTTALTILQNHYPERLGCAICYHAPKLFSVTWKAVGPFIDPVTKKKIHFVEKGPREAQHMAELLDMTLIEECMGGQLKGSLYNHDAYAARMQREDADRAARLAAAASDPPVKPMGGQIATGTATISSSLGETVQKMHVLDLGRSSHRIAANDSATSVRGPMHVVEG